MSGEQKYSAFTANLWLLLGGLVICFVSFLYYVHAEKEIDRANEARHKSLSLAAELRQSSDDLTRMVRTYVVTGNPLFKQHFLEVLDIRDGRRPRPQGYDNVYWDLVLGDDIRPSPSSGDAKPLLQRIKEAGASEEEFAKLAEAKKNSDELTAIEFSAMRLMESSPGNDKVRLEASRMLYDERYRAAKARIMAPISDFCSMVNRRTQDAVEHAARVALAMRLAFLAAVFLFSLMLWRAFRVLEKTLGTSPGKLYERIVKLGRGEFSAENLTRADKRDTVLAWLHEAEVTLAEAETRRKRIESSLQESTQSLEEAQRIAKLGSWTLDLRSNHLEWTDGIFRIFEIDRERFGASYEAFLNAIHPEDRDAVNKAYTDSVANKTPYEIEHRLLMMDGRIKYVLERCETLYSQDGVPLLSRGTVQDISERYQADMALREQRKLFETVIENIPSMVFLKRASDLRMVLWNKAGERLLGYPREQLLGKNDHDNFPKEQADFFATKDRKVLDETGYEDIPEETITTRDGSNLILHTQKVAIRDEQGGAQYLLGISEDITERKRYEDAVRESAEHIRTVFDNVVDGIVTIDERGIVDTFNRAAERMFGYRAEEVIGRNVSMLMPNPYRDAHDSYIRNYLASGVARVIGVGREVTGGRADGSTFPMDLAVSEIARKGQRMFIGVARDITERKRIEQMKNEFVSTVSHELRTPLTSIAGALGLLSGGALGELPEQVRSLIEIASKNSVRLTHLINDLLDMEKIAAGKLHFNMQLQPLMPLVEQALEANHSFGEQYQVRYVLKQRADGVEVKVDGQRLMQVLANFLSNAAKFSPVGGEVEVSVRRMEWRVRIEVRDHGPGIPEAFKPRIFQKFSQADSSDTRTKGGTGLGLAITRELAERMGGRVGFDSEEGEGATFYVELPVLEAAASKQAHLHAELPEDAPCILVVEDDADVARMLELILNRAGYRVDMAGKGGEALLLLEQRRYAAMTLDLILPDISGLELLRQVRHRTETSSLPVIVISVKMEEGQLAISGEFPGVEWLPKPVDERMLLAAIRQVTPQELGKKLRVLHVEDDADLHQVISRMGGAHCEFEHAAMLSEARAMLALERFDVVLLDIGLPDGSGWDLLPQIRALQPAPRVIVLSGTELTPQEQLRVEAALLKSRVTPRDLLDALGQRIRQKGGA